MLVIVGLIVLLVAVLVALIGVLGNSGPAHPLTENFSVFGYHVTGVSPQSRSVLRRKPRQIVMSIAKKLVCKAEAAKVATKKYSGRATLQHPAAHRGTRRSGQSQHQSGRGQS